MRPQPRSQEGPEPLHRVDVNLVEAVAVLIARILAPTVTDRLVPISPGGQTGIDIIFVREDAGPRVHDFGDDRLDGDLLNIRQHPQDDLAAPLDQTEDRGLLLLQRSPATRSFEPVAAARPAFF
jgi:hypothetical protein